MLSVSICHKVITLRSFFRVIKFATHLFDDGTEDAVGQFSDLALPVGGHGRDLVEQEAKVILQNC